MAWNMGRWIVVASLAPFLAASLGQQDWLVNAANSTEARGFLHRRLNGTDALKQAQEALTELEKLTSAIGEVDTPWTTIDSLLQKFGKISPLFGVLGSVLGLLSMSSEMNAVAQLMEKLTDDLDEFQKETVEWFRVLMQEVNSDTCYAEYFPSFAAIKYAVHTLKNYTKDPGSEALRQLFLGACSSGICGRHTWTLLNGLSGESFLSCNLVNLAYDGDAKNQYFKGSIRTMLKHVGTLVMTATQGIMVEAAYYSLKDGSRSSGETIASTFSAQHENAVNYWNSKLHTSYNDARLNAIASAPGYITWVKSQLGSLQGKDENGNLGFTDDGKTLAKNLTSVLNQNYGNYLFASLITSANYWNQNKQTIKYNKDVAHLFTVDSDLVIDIISIPVLATPPTKSSILGKIGHNCRGGFPPFLSSWCQCASRFGPWKCDANIAGNNGPSCSSCNLQYQAIMSTQFYNQVNAKNWHNFFIDTTAIADYAVIWSGWGSSGMPGNLVLVDFTM